MFDKDLYSCYYLGINHTNKGEGMKKNIIKFGNSVGITLDKMILEITGIKTSDTLDVSCSKGKIVIKPIKD